MPEFYIWAILLINQQDEIGEKQLSVFGSIGGQNSPLMHVPLSEWVFIKVHAWCIQAVIGSGQSAQVFFIIIVDEGPL